MESWEIFSSIIAFVAILLVAGLFQGLNKWKRWEIVESKSILRLIYQIPKGNTPELTLTWYEYAQGSSSPTSPLMILLSPNKKYRTILDQYATALCLAGLPVMVLRWKVSRNNPVNFANIASKISNLDCKSKLELYTEMQELKDELEDHHQNVRNSSRDRKANYRTQANRYQNNANNLIIRETKYRTRLDRYQNIVGKLKRNLAHSKDLLEKISNTISPEKAMEIGERAEGFISNIEKADAPVNKSKLFIVFRSVVKNIMSSVSGAAKDPQNQWILISPEIGEFGQWEIFSGNGNNIRVQYSLDSPKRYLLQIQAFIARLKIPEQNLAPFPIGGLNLAKQETVSLAKIISWLSVTP